MTIVQNLNEFENSLLFWNLLVSAMALERILVHMKMEELKLENSHRYQ